MKIASWNVNSLKVRLAQVLDWSAENQPDVLGLQETKLTDENFPAAEIEAAGYRVAYAGQKTYNGVAVLAREEITEVVTDIPGLDDPDRRILAATIGNLRFINLYVVNGKTVGSQAYRYKLEWLEAVRAWLAGQLETYPRVAVVGDFNITPDDRDVHDPDQWREKILCSTPEREALYKIYDLGFADTFRLHHEDAGVFSWWDYRMGAFRRGLGLRIDLILVSPALAEVCTASYVDPRPRRLQRPSDHAPVVAEFA